MFEAGEYQVIIVGAGHAGCEAALASARMGCKTLMVTLNMDNIALMPCNPSIGGPAKGHLVREIDALGGQMALTIDKTRIQMRMLNTGKGPAVHALRAQADKKLYQQLMKETMEKQQDLDVKQGLVEKILLENNQVSGIQLQSGAIYRAQCVVLTTGTYLRGRIIIGDLTYSGGPNGQHAAMELTGCLRKLGIEMVRFKTGTPARVDARSLDFSKMTIQPGSQEHYNFSFMTPEEPYQQLPCYLTYTTEKTHEIIRQNIHRAPMYTGIIEGTGPRYCPSIEDKVVRFADKTSHQLFVEPEGWNTQEMYVQGMSTSLPEDVQIEFLRTIIGFENVQIMRPGYAIEYDSIVPTQLNLSLEFKDIKGLFSAGQLNGTSGYEEAAAQGIMAGINAALKVAGRQPLLLGRSDAYIGVLIDDLVTKGTNEPYRLMTSRAEYRLLLRQDNADLRLTPKGYDIGLASQERQETYCEKNKKIIAITSILKQTTITPTDAIQEKLRLLGSSEIRSGMSLFDLLKRTEIQYPMLVMHFDMPKTDKAVAEQVEINAKYQGYIHKQLQEIERFEKLENKKIPEDIDYNSLTGLSVEARQKLTKVSPHSIGQASRISGVSPADISVLLVHLEQQRRRGREDAS